VPNPTTSENSTDRDKSARSLELALAAARTAGDNRGRDIVVLDTRGQTSLFDYFVIATGTSRRQLHAMSEEIDHKLEDELNDQRMGIEGYDECRWIILDYGTVVIHLFDEEARHYYRLEQLWADAEPVDFQLT
jgi:ribosome-associated protein